MPYSSTSAKIMYVCRQCENEINQATEICPHCGVDLTDPLLIEGPIKPKPTIGKILLRWGVLLTVLLGAIWSFLWFIVPERRGNPTVMAEKRAAESLLEVNTALGTFASGDAGGYPQQLEAVGEKARLAAQLAQSVNYQIQYIPGPVEADGMIRSYVLQAKAGNYGFRNFYLDNSGILRATREGRAATSEDPPY